MLRQLVPKQQEMVYMKQQLKAIGVRQSGMSPIDCSNRWLIVQLVCIRFKLHLRSKFGNGKALHPNVPPLPPNKTVVDVIADFLRYLLHCAASYIQDTYSNGPTIWTSLQDDLHFVLSHPNGWEGKEQSQMRQAAVKAGLVPDTPSGHSRLVFVTEGEASLHFTIEEWSFITGNGGMNDNIVLFASNTTNYVFNGQG
jgi:hypothetical protein